MVPPKDNSEDVEPVDAARPEALGYGSSNRDWLFTIA